MFVRVNEYQSITSGGVRTIVQTGHGIRIVPLNVVRIYSIGLGYEEVGGNDHECFYVYLLDGTRVITDWAGIQEINNWVQPS